MTDYNESVSGFKVRGNWADVVEHGERVTFALEELDVDGDNLSEWNDWRPKQTENLTDEITEKTAEKASTSEGEGEQEGKTATDDMQVAGEKFVESYSDVSEQPDEAYREWIDSLGYAVRAVDTVTRKSLRRIEHAIYENVMTLLAPYYFDNQLISANINRVQQSPPEYEFEINVNDDELKNGVSDKLEHYDEEYTRWHVSVPKKTDSIVDTEGVELDDDHEGDEENPKPDCT